MRKKFLCLFLCLTLLFSLMPMSVSAAGAVYTVGDNTFYTGSGDQSGSGWKWEEKTHTLTLDDYYGGSITTNSDMRIVVNSKSHITGDYKKSSYSGYAGISVLGNLQMTLYAELSIETKDSESDNYGIICGVLDLTIQPKGVLKDGDNCDWLINCTVSSNMIVYGAIECNAALMLSKGNCNLKLDGSITVDPSKKTEKAINIEYADFTITGKGKLNIGNKFYRITDGICVCNGTLEIGSEVQIIAYCDESPIRGSEFIAKGNARLELYSMNTCISVHDVDLTENVDTVLNGFTGISGFNVTIENRNNEGIFSGSYVKGEKIYYRPTGMNVAHSDSFLFFVDHGSIFAQGSGTDYFTSNRNIFYSNYGYSEWNRSGKAILVAEEDVFTNIYGFGGTGEMSITSHKGNGIRFNIYGSKETNELSYNGTLSIDALNLGIACGDVLDITGNCDIDINSYEPCITASRLNLEGSGALNLYCGNDAAIKVFRTTTNISRDGDIYINNHESFAIDSYESVYIGGTGDLLVRGNGHAVHTIDGDVHFQDERTIDFLTDYSPIKFDNPENKIILEGKVGPISIETTRDFHTAIENSNALVVDSTGNYYIVEGDPAGLKVVYDIKVPDPTPEVTPEVTPVVTPETTPAVTPTVTSTPSVTPTPVATPEVTTTPSVTTTPVVTPSTTTTPVATPETTPEPTVEVVPNNPSTMVEGEYTEADIPVVNPVVEEAELDVGDFVQRCYKVALEREAEEEGYKYWCDSLNNGQACGAQVGFGFIFSQEYLNKEKSNEDFVNDLYAMFFGREADSEGYAYWLDALENGDSRENIFAGFANSQEFYDLCKKYAVVSGWYAVGVDNGSQGGVNCFVARLYKICFKRLPDLGGQAYWVSQLIDGSLDGTTAASGFVFSAEFTNLELTDEEFVAYMYAAFFARKADVQGFNYWMTEIRNGMSRNDVFSGFTGSAEFINLCDSYGIIA